MVDLSRAVARSGRSRVTRGCKPLDGARGVLAPSLLPTAGGGKIRLCNSPAETLYISCVPGKSQVILLLWAETPPTVP